MKGIKKTIFGSTYELRDDIAWIEALNITDIGFDYNVLRPEPNIALTSNDSVSFNYQVYKKFNY